MRKNKKSSRTLDIPGIQQLLKAGQTSKARSAATRYAKAHPKNADAWQLLAHINGQLGDLAGVEQACRRIVKLQPGASAWLNLAISLQNQGRLPEATEACLRALQYSPGDAGTLAKLCQLHLAQPDFENARSCLEKIPQHHPDYAPASHEYGMTLLRHQHTQEALECIVELESRVPGYPGIQISLAYCYHFAGKKTKSAEAFRQSCVLYGQDQGRLLELGDLAAETGEMPAAVTLYEKAYAAGITPELTQYRLACALFHEHYYKQALPHLKQVARLKPGDARIQFSLGRCFEKLADTGSARNWYLKALETDRDKAKVYCKLGGLDLVDKQLTESMAYYKKAIASDHTSIDAHCGIAMVHIEERSMDKARETLEAAQALEPENSQVSDLYNAIAQFDSSSSDERYLKNVTALFDEYADRFDEHLVQGLRYSVPEHFYTTVMDIVNDRQETMDILDLGCGTGLCGLAFRDIASSLTGIDISPRMIEKTRQRGIYTDLAVSNLPDYLDSTEKQFDLILSGDVFIYCSDLREIFAGCRRVLRSGGLFVFSEEDSEDEDISLNSTCRFAHSSRYIHDIAAATGFEVILGKSIPVRKEMDRDVPGSIYVLQCSIGN